ncbi:MAG: MBL fold metallo-hydrolase [Gemmatimonadaceae bacterium]|nr:MBL fold metallo-hydrolase [Gemmatimonadaceae bacterium]
MIVRESYGDVVRYHTWNRSARIAGLSVSAYRIRDVLIDCAFPQLRAEFAVLLRTEPVRGAIVTHAHEDHAGNVPLLQEMGIPVQLAPDTAAALAHPAPLRAYRRLTWGSPRPLGGPVTPFADPTLALAPAPGHSPDHHVVWDASTGTLFSADLFLGVKVRLSHAYESPRTTEQELRRWVAVAPARVFCAHRGLVPGAAKALHTKAEWLAEMIGRVADAVARGESDRAITRRLLGGEDRTGIVSFGEYANVNFARAVRAGR